jgi:hypothetical protein
MSRFALSVLLALSIALGLAATAVADPAQPVGPRLNLFGGFQVFPANQPFHVKGGWGLDSNDGITAPALGHFGFSLSIDGQEQRHDFVEKFDTEDPTFGRLRWRFWVYNFPQGLTGTHVLSGRWFGPCADLVAGGFTTGPCENKAAITPATSIATVPITVVFTP